MAYSSKDDLLLGNIPLPVYLSATTVIKDADDEIDSHIGFIYKTPLNVEDVPSNPIPRPARLLLKRISSHLASGRLILAVAAAQEDVQLHAYGKSLVNEALEALQNIVNRVVTIEGAELLPDANANATGPLISNLDEHSQVEAFYRTFQTSGLPYGIRYP